MFYLKHAYIHFFVHGFVLCSVVVLDSSFVKLLTFSATLFLLVLSSDHWNGQLFVGLYLIADEQQTVDSWQSSWPTQINRGYWYETAWQDAFAFFLPSTRPFCYRPYAVIVLPRIRPFLLTTRLCAFVFHRQVFDVRSAFLFVFAFVFALADVNHVASLCGFKIIYIFHYIEKIAYSLSNVV